MAEQMALPPFQRTSVTSVAGALDAARRTPTQLERVYRFVADRGARGATRAEIEQGLGLRMSSVCGRVADLLAAGRLVGSSLPPRRSRFGSKGEVLVAVASSEES